MHIVEKKVYNLCLENLNRKNHLGDLGGKCKRQCLKEIGWEDWIGFVRLVIRVSGGFFCTF
jgi:hypothetical protein